jgi:two-component system sensor histidine kinase KdpD
MLKALAVTGSGFRRSLTWLGVFVLVTTGLVSIRDQLRETHVALAYLLVVLGGSSREGGKLGLVLSALSFLAFDWFFVPPYGTLAVAKPVYWGVLAAFLVTSVIAARLLERAQLGAETLNASRLKDAVVASVSHDLRTPLTTIKALAAEIAGDGDERALSIQEEADRLNAMVTDLLDIARLNSGTASINTEPNEAEDLVGAALQRVQGTAGGHEIRVSLEPGDPLLIGKFDFAQTLRALVNLLENALKYSPPSQPVELRVRRADNWLTFSVLDRGEGIPNSEREKIFEPFYRKPGLPSDVGGAGLGLSIARALVNAQHGSLTHEPRHGGGSVFILRVPALDVEDITGS